jgi:hypothetical protein
MRFTINGVENFSVKLSIIYMDRSNTEMCLKLNNFSLENRALLMHEINKSPGVCKFQYDYLDYKIPYIIRIYLEKDGNISSPYNIYPGQLKLGANYFWNNNGAFYISDTLISLYINHKYLEDYVFENNKLDTSQYISEYFIN